MRNTHTQSHIITQYVVGKYFVLVKVTQGETVISHVKISPGQDRSGATSIIDARTDKHVCSGLLEHV